MRKSMAQKLGLAAVSVAAGAFAAVGIAAPASAASPVVHNTAVIENDGGHGGNGGGRDHDGQGRGGDHDGRDHNGRGDGRDHDGRDHDGRDHDGRDHDGRDNDGRGFGRPGFGFGGTRCVTHLTGFGAIATCFNVWPRDSIDLSIRCAGRHGVRIERYRRSSWDSSRVVTVAGRCDFDGRAISAWAG